MRELRVRHADELTASQLARVRQIYQQAFEPRHQVPFTELATTGPADMFLAAVDGNQPAGFAALRLLAAAGWTFLRYYAIAADRRRAGYGQQFWQLVHPALRAASWPAKLVFEVEHPEHAASAEARQTAAARIAFWTRCGCHQLPVSAYSMPDFTGVSLPEPMLLMTSDPVITANPGQTADLVLAIYQGRYQLPPHHPLVTTALASIPNPAS